MGKEPSRKTAIGVGRVSGRTKSGPNKVKPVLRIVSVEPVIHGVLKIVWTDGHAGIVDMRPIIAEGRIFSYLADPEHFKEVRVGYYGHHIEWKNEKGEEIDFGADSLRARAERQAAILALAS